MILPSATKKYENETILNFRQFAVCDPRRLVHVGVGQSAARQAQQVADK
jgi:hypothetical protein